MWKRHFEKFDSEQSLGFLKSCLLKNLTKKVKTFKVWPVEKRSQKNVVGDAGGRKGAKSSAENWFNNPKQKKATKLLQFWIHQVWQQVKRSEIFYFHYFPKESHVVEKFGMEPWKKVCISRRDILSCSFGIEKAFFLRKQVHVEIFPCRGADFAMLFPEGKSTSDLY